MREKAQERQLTMNPYQRKQGTSFDDYTEISLRTVLFRPYPATNLSFLFFSFFG